MTKIRIKKIRIHNFLSFVDEEWDFENTSRLVLIKGINKDTESTKGNTSNGSGKSSWAHALMFSLFGQLGGKFHLANLQNQFSDTIDNGFKMYVDVEVDTELSKNNVKHWRMVRGFQKSSTSILLQLFELKEDGEWVDISKSTSANTQKYIEDNVLHMNFEMYQRLVMLSIDDRYNFFKLNASQKRDFVETLFDTSVYSKMYKMLSDDLKTGNMNLQNLKVSQVKLLKSKELCEEEIEKYKSSVNEQIETTTKEKGEAQLKVDSLQPQFDEIHERRKVVQEALQKVQESKTKLESVMKTCNEAITKARVDISTCNSTISHHEKELNKHKEVLSMICDDCKSVVNKFYSLDVYRKEIEKLNGRIGEQETTISTLNGKLDKLNELSTQTRKDEMTKLGELSETQVDERNLQFQKTQMLNNVLALEKRIADLVASIEDNRRIPSYNVYQKTLEEMDEIEVELKNEVTHICLLKVGSDIVSPDSIKRNIISKVVASINTMLNANLSELCVNFTCNLSSDMNDYVVMSANEEVDLALRSAGEQMKLLISTQLAFRKFLMSRFNVGVNVMIIDEVVDKALDSVSIQTLLGMLLQLGQKENMHISIISHREEVAEMVKTMPETQLVVVRKENNISKIIRE